VTIFQLKHICPPAADHPIHWTYDRAELIADGIVHAFGVTFGLAHSWSDNAADIPPFLERTQSHREVWPPGQADAAFHPMHPGAAFDAIVVEQQKELREI